MEQQNNNKKQKNILIKLGIVILFILFMIGISAGVSSVIYNNKNIPASSAVENGLSAYEIAVQYGYDGSVEDWLDSLNGKSAYDIAAENGYSGTEAEWIAALESAANQKNETIKTASFSANGELIITLSDGTQLNLGKAVGENGKDGKDGHNGANGVNGKDGVGISSAKINSDGQLVMNFSNGNSVNLDKVVGMNGADGVGVTKSEINENGELVLTYSNGQTYTLGSVIGAAGKDGVDGIDGVNGVDGKDGTNGKDGINGTDGKDGVDGRDGISITNAVVDDNGGLVLTYSDGTTANLGAVVGKDGQNGNDGKDGADGIGVINAEITSEGELVLTYSNGQRSNLGNVIGANGKDGADGKDGKDGADGISVVKSEINSRGELVLTYSDGNIDNLGVVVGANGKDGENGKDGTNGKDGKDGLNGTDGEDGVGIDNIVINADGQLEITLTNGTSMNLGNIKGADGQNGRDGKDGQNGIDGTDGKDGIGIEEATINSSGELVLSYSNGDFVNLGKVVGADGKNGENGKDGENGTDGKDGEKGADGEDGISIVNAEVNPEGELVITYSDGNSDNLGRIIGRDGVNGKDGTNGVDGKDGKDGENGKDGQDGQNGMDGKGITSASINDNGELELTFSDLSSINLGKIVGRDGKDGENGKDGTNGTNGENGQDGVGIKNVTITEGELSIELTSGTVINLGNINGENGIGISKSQINESGELVLTYTDGETANLGRVVGKDGENGKDGADGQNGADGKDGINGTDGKDGIGIKSVSVAEDGQLVVTLTNDTILVAGNVKGDKGDKGDTGAQGEKGDDGLSAYEIAVKYGKTTAKSEEEWLKELKGEKGDTGAKGADGEQGAQGEKGKDGKDGRGIDRMEIIDGELWVFYTDNTEQNLGNIGSGDSDNTNPSLEMLKFTRLDDGTLEVAVDPNYKLLVEKISIPDSYNGISVTKIAKNAFDSCTYLKEVSIPNSVTVIELQAFFGCASLNSITIPANVKSIGIGAFQKSALTEVYFDVTKGWIRTPGGTVDSSILEDPESAAAMLVKDYNVSWSRNE